MRILLLHKINQQPQGQRLKMPSRRRFSTALSSRSPPNESSLRQPQGQAPQGLSGVFYFPFPFRWPSRLSHQPKPRLGSTRRTPTPHHALNELGVSSGQTGPGRAGPNRTGRWVSLRFASGTLPPQQVTTSARLGHRRYVTAGPPRIPSPPPQQQQQLGRAPAAARLRPTGGAGN